MQRGFLFLALVFLTGLVAFPFAAIQPPPPETRIDMWKKVDEAVAQGLPKTALEALQPIIDGAMADKAFPEAIKAIGKRIALEGQIEGGSPAVRIVRMQKELEVAPAEMKPAMHALMGYWYWSYFLENRWVFARRSATESTPGDDFSTWDLKRLFAEIDAQYSAGLVDEKMLQAIPIASYDALLEKGTLPDSYRPTLYDFLAFTAIDFYASGEQAGTARQDRFEIAASSPALGNTEEFIGWKPETVDRASPKLKAILLYQKLLQFHRDDKDRSAFLDTELGRLQFLANNAVGEERASRIKSALQSFVSSHAEHELSATARHRLAQMIYDEGDWVQAREVAMQGKNAFPESVGGRQCHNLIQAIEAKSVSVNTERVWSSPRSSLRVRYRNVNKIYFRAVKADWLTRFSQDRWRPDQINQDDRDRLLQLPPVRSWSSDLPETDDYREATHDVPAPEGLEPGYYFLLSSLRPDFRDEENAIAACEVWVTKLALVVHQHWRPGKLAGFVLDNRTGEPIPGAEVKAIYRDRRTSAIKQGPALRTDQNGMFEFKENSVGMFLLVSHAGDMFASQSEFTTYELSRPTIGTQVVLFTDRSIYRPGQTVSFKGIAIIADPATNRYDVVPRTPFRVLFRDINGKEVESINVRSNDYGSFSGTFTAPRDRGTGAMAITVDNVLEGATQVNVEEYKRPKFKVDMELPKDAVKLGDDVSVTGRAMSYTGAPVQSGMVRYRVVRQVRWPDWFLFCYGWRIPPMLGQSQEISNGWAETGPDGSFTVQFPARPDRSVPEADQPIFSFEVTADVTDGTGETRTGSTNVAVSYAALQANLIADDWQVEGKDVQVRINTSTPSGVAMSATGKLTVHQLREPESVLRPNILGQGAFRPMRAQGGPVRQRPAPATTIPDPSDYRNWPLGDTVAQSEFTTKDDGTSDVSFPLPRGIYRVVLESQDRFGKPVRSELNVKVIQENAPSLGLKLPHHFAMPQGSVEPGTTWKGVWGSGYESARAFVEIEHRGVILKRYWTRAGSTQASIEQPVDESMRGGFTVRVTIVRENRAYMESRTIDVPWTNKELQVRWDRFRSKLEPGTKETWSLTIKDPKATAAVAEMVAGLYDASLDAFLPHRWMDRLSVHYRESWQGSAVFQNMALGFQHFRGNFDNAWLPVDPSYRRFPQDLRMIPNIHHQLFGMRRARGGAPGAPMPEMAEAMSAPGEGAPFTSGIAADAAMTLEKGGAGEGGGGDGARVPGPSLDSISPRKNLNETAFFFPHLMSDREGNVKIEFTMPEALTTWRFLSFAHDAELRSGGWTDTVVSAKDLMVQPNPPRFLRQGDILEFSVKVTNQAPTVQRGRVSLQLSDAITEASVDAAFENSANEKDFEIPGNSAKSFRWRLKVPEGAKPIIYKAIAATERLSDGEQGMLPVLSNRILVTESLPLPIRGESTKVFELKKLIESASSESLRHQAVTVQMTSQPAWYAVLALPYLMEYPYDCSEQTFNRLYANALARHMVLSDPKIERVFQAWRDIQPEALDSPLSKNEDLKSVMIEETPWLRDSDRESQARRNVGLLFDKNRLEFELQKALGQLGQMQRENGMWPWFPGGRDNEYLSLYIVTGFGRLRHLGVKIDEAIALKALERLDAWMQELHDRIPAKDRIPKNNFLSPTIAMYLYGRSFFLIDRPIGEPYQAALKFWQQQARTHWLSQSRQSQAHMAIGMKRMGDSELPKAILASLKENSVTNEEMGMFWRDTERSWWWQHAPIETQAMMIEALDEVLGDAAAVEECKVWLLKQKQTQDWKTTKATADAVYALLLRGQNWLSSDELVSVTVGDMTIVPEKVEAGTGFYEHRFSSNDVRPEMGRVTVTKKDDGVSWGSIHWQYLEQIDKVTPYEGTPLKLEKKIYRRVLKEAGPVLEEMAGPASVGDELVCRIVLRTDRDMEYVHLKDSRGSGTEPVNVLSGYRFQDGLYYYESTRDTATHFFIDYLRKGTYVFETTVRVQHAGFYPMGLATIQCMYAPEFNSHSESPQLVVE